MCNVQYLERIWQSAVPALLAQFLHDPLYGGLALAAVAGHGVDDDALHVTGQRHAAHRHDHLLPQQRLVRVRRVRHVRHLLLHVDVAAEAEVLAVHLHAPVAGVHPGHLRGVAHAVGADQPLDPVSQTPVTGDDSKSEIVLLCTTAHVHSFIRRGIQ